MQFYGSAAAGRALIVNASWQLAHQLHLFSTQYVQHTGFQHTAGLAWHPDVRQPFAESSSADMSSVEVHQSYCRTCLPQASPCPCREGSTHSYSLLRTRRPTDVTLHVAVCASAGFVHYADFGDHCCRWVSQVGALVAMHPAWHSGCMSVGDRSAPGLNLAEAAEISRTSSQDAWCAGRDAVAGEFGSTCLMRTARSGTLRLSTMPVLWRPCPKCPVTL
jgi:hypothetical protein